MARLQEGDAAGVRLIGAPEAPLLARPYYQGGDPGPIVAALAHVPELLEACVPFLDVVFRPSALPARRKELAVLRTSARLECRYCVESHTVVALDAGLTRAEVSALREAEVPVGAFPDPAELALLAWVDALAVPGAVAPEARRDLEEHFDDADVVELTVLVGATMMLNRFCTALELPTAPATRERLAQAGM